MSSLVVTSSRTRIALRDPVLLVPLVVAAGLAVGWLGVDSGVSGTRVAADLALSWALVAASVVALERGRWRRSRALLAAAAFALLAADLQWASSHALWTLGFLLEALWVALLVQFVLTFPEGRPWSRVAGLTIAGAYVASFGGQLASAFVSGDARNLLSVAPQQSVADASDRAQGILGIAVALTALFLVAGRLLALRGPAQRAQAPLLIAAGLSAPVTVLWLVWVSGTGEGAPRLETTGRAVALLVPLGVVTGILWSQLHRREASDLVVELRTEGPASLRERLARVLGDPTLDLAYRLDDGRYVDATGQPLELPQSPSRAITLVTSRGEELAALVHDPALLDEPALVGVRPRDGRARARERAAGGRGACAARGGARLAGPDRRRHGRRAAPHRAQPPRRCAAAARDACPHSRERGFPP